LRVAILFDLDGTLIDSTEAILESFSYAFEKFKLSPPSDKEILALIGHPLDFMFLNLGIKEPTPFVSAYKEHYHKIFLKKTKLLPGAKEAIILASSFARLGVVTTKTGKYSKELLEYWNLLDYFGVVIGREDVIHPKPHPEPILKALHHLKLPPSKSFMIGDTCLDMEAAKASGVKGVGVLCGYGREEELKRCGEYLFFSAYEAVKFVKKISFFN